MPRVHFRLNLQIGQDQGTANFGDGSRISGPRFQTDARRSGFKVGFPDSAAVRPRPKIHFYGKAFSRSLTSFGKDLPVGPQPTRPILPNALRFRARATRPSFRVLLNRLPRANYAAKFTWSARRHLLDDRRSATSKHSRTARRRCKNRPLGSPGIARADLPRYVWARRTSPPPCRRANGADRREQRHANRGEYASRLPRGGGPTVKMLMHSWPCRLPGNCPDGRGAAQQCLVAEDSAEVRSHRWWFPCVSGNVAVVRPQHHLVPGGS